MSCVQVVNELLNSFKRDFAAEGDIENLGKEGF